MSHDRSVVVLCPNGRRNTVSVTPNTTLLQVNTLKVLEQVCAQHKLDASYHCVKREGQRKMLDLSTLFRYSGLPNMAKLELVACSTPRSSQGSMVTLAVLTEAGGRLQGSFPPTASLWQVLSDLGLASGHGDPVVVCMQQEVCGQSNLQQCSLKSLGLTQGKAALRLLFRGTESCEVGGPEAAVDSSEQEAAPVGTEGPKQEQVEDSEGNGKEQEGNGKEQEGNGKEQEGREVVTEEELSSTVPAALPPHRQMPPLHVHCDRRAVVFQLGDSSLQVPHEDVPDSFFEVTMRDVEVMQRDLKKQVESLDSAPLQTSSMRRQRQAAHLLAIVRVCFPDQWVLQGFFEPQETLRALVAFIREHLADPTLKFELYTAPPKQVLKKGSVTFAEAGFVPTAVVYLNTASTKQPLLSGRSLSECVASALQAEALTLQHMHRSVDSAAMLTPSTSEAGRSDCSTSANEGVSQYSKESEHVKESVRPKWFRIGKQ